MKFLKTTLTLSAFLFVYQIGNSCSCIGTQSFCESSFNYPNIAIVEVINVNDENGSFDVSVEEMLTGSSKENFISINYTFTSCTKSYNAKVGNRLLINFNTLSNTGESTYPNYTFFSCAINFLEIIDDNIVGQITGKDFEVMSINKFKSSIPNCIDLSVVDPGNSLIQFYIRLINNPTSDKFEITPLPVQDKNTEVSIIDANGMLINKFSFSDHTRNYEFDISHYSNGVYFCIISFRGFSIIRKVLKI